MLRQIITFGADLRCSLLALLFLGVAGTAQAQSLDKIDAIVGEDIILHSEIVAQMQYYLSNGMKDDGTMYCRVMEEKIFENLLLNKARQDSIEVTEAMVDAEVDRKVAYFRQAYGDELEKIYGKPEIEIKADIKEDIRDQMLSEQMRQKIVSEVAVTPREVREFFKKIPKDSLPLLPAEVELFHLAVLPQASEKSKQEARKKLEQIRKKIVDEGADFQDMARENSMDYGSAKVGGELGTFGRGRMVPEFEEVAFQADIGEISTVFESDFGFHILQVYDRVGEQVSARHILIAPRVTLDDDSAAVRKLRRLREDILAGRITFPKAAMETSADQATAPYGGAIKDPQTGENRISIDALDADFFFLVDNLKEGEISQPEEWFSPGRKRGYHMVMLKARHEPHVAGLDTDYAKLQQAALQNKQATALDQWFKRGVTNIYIDIKNEECVGVLPYLLPYSNQ